MELTPDQEEYLELLRDSIIHLPRETIEQHLIMQTEAGFKLGNAYTESADRVNYLSKLGLSLIDQLEKQGV